MDIEKLLKELKAQLLALLEGKFNEFKPELQKEITLFLEQSKDKLVRWTLLLADQSITKDEFEWLIKSQKELLTLKALQSAGISKIRINNLKNTIIQTIIKTVLMVI